MQSPQNPSQLTEHLFRHQAGRMVATLTRVFGLHNLELAEDVVQETFAKAISEWTFRIPDEPAAWLMRVAKNKAIDLLRRQRHRQKFADEWQGLLESEYSASGTVAQLFLDHEIQDSQLRMIFACCHPALGAEEQLLLTLKTCSAFSIEEAASALLLQYEAAKKRLQRARALIVEQGIAFEVPQGPQLAQRLDQVLLVLLLMFNEGYKSSTQDELIRKDMCMEAMRLAILLTVHPLTQFPKCFALVGLMCLQAARFPARLDTAGDIVQLEYQDRNKWDKELIQVGIEHLVRAGTDSPSEYHLQGAIALTHMQAPDFQSTDWPLIYRLYQQLAQHNPSPMVLLNKALACMKSQGPQNALREFRAIPKLDHHLAHNHLFPASLAEMLAASGQPEDAMQQLHTALQLAPTEPERRLLQRKIQEIAPTTPD